MRKVLPTMILAAISMDAIAQQMIWQNDICPDWTFTDIDGVEHNLYSYLDAGYTVFFDVSATWCPPCWDIHESHVLDSLYLNYGPGTAANNVMVFLLEGDDSTDLSDLAGTGDQTLGDWVTGTPYPIIDNAGSILDLLHFNSFPFVWSVCPNRYIGPGYSSTMGEMASTAQYCQDYYLADSPNDAALLYVVDRNRCYGQERDLFVHLQNVGNSTLTGAVLETTVYLHQDQTSTPVVDTLEWNGALATYEYVTLAAAQVELPVGHHTASVRLLGSDDSPLNDMTGTTAIAGTTAPGTQITLELLTDDHAADLGWSLMQTDQQLPLAGVGAGTYANNTFYTETWNLEEDACYAFSIHTVDLQGLSAPGFFRLIANGVPFSGEAALRYNVETVDFRTDTDVGIPAPQPTTSLHIAPNPFDARTSIDLSTIPGPVNVTIIDASGRMVESTALQGGTVGWLERGGLSAGFYTLVVSDASNAIHRETLLVR